MKILLVGECNPYSKDPELALYPHPTGSAGYRLCYTILGLDAKTYLERFDRANLCAARWNDRTAKVAADVMREMRPGPKILLGSKVARAFGVKFDQFSMVAFSTDRINRHPCLVWPHPSGRARIWNDPSAIACARDQLRRFTKRVEEFYNGNPDISSVPKDS